MVDELIKKCMKELKPYHVGFWKMEEIHIRELCYADDMVTFESTEENLQENVNIEEPKRINLKCNREKQKTRIIDNESLMHNIKIEGQEIELSEIINCQGTL